MRSSTGFVTHFLDLLLVVIVIVLLARVVDLWALLPAARLYIFAIFVSGEGFLVFLIIQLSTVVNQVLHAHLDRLR